MKSKIPRFIDSEAAAALLSQASKNLNRPIVCIQGLGFVGAAMAIAVAFASNENGAKLFTVIGVDVPTKEGARRAKSISEGIFPFYTDDVMIQEALSTSVKDGNIYATCSDFVYEHADIVIVDVHLDVNIEKEETDFSGIIDAVEVVSKRLRSGTLIIVETTVPPGTCEYVLAPKIQEVLKQRGLPLDSIDIAHSYERVMPGPDYFNSITNYWRVYSGCTLRAADRCESFLRKIIDTSKFPLKRLSNPRASETAKILENTYRATTIALMDEWGRYAEHIGINMFEVVEAIRMRPTHSNIRQPGLGVGGYCLTKDPIFGSVSAKLFANENNISFPISKLSVSINQKMPLHVIEIINNFFIRKNTNLSNKNVLILGMAYRPDVGDLRHSPSEVLAIELQPICKKIICQDPYAENSLIGIIEIDKEIPKETEIDVIILAVNHAQYKGFDWASWIGSGGEKLFVDCNNGLNPDQISNIQSRGCHVISVGKGI